MATKRKRTSKPNTAAAPATDASKPGASGRVAPRKRTDVPPAKPKPRAAGTPHVEENEGQTPLEQTSRAAKVRAKAAARLKEDAAAIVDDAAKDDGAEASTEAERGKRRRERAEAKPRKKRWPLVVAGSVLLVVLLIVGGFSWDRWLRYDDARELQGEWQVDGTTRVVVVDGVSIKLTDDVAYAYTIDPTAKTIEFTFGGMEGSGRYRFSADRSQLVVMEGSSYSALSTLFEDIGWMWDGLVRLVQGQAPVQPEAGEGVTVLARVSHDAAAQPRNDEGLAAGAGNATDGASGAGSNGGSSADAGGTGANAPAGDAGSSGDAGSGANADGGNAAASGNASGFDSAAGAGASGTNASPSGGSGSNSPAPDNRFDLDDVNDAGA